MNIEEMNLTEEQTAAVRKLIQSETDKVRTDYSNKLRAVNDELNKYKPQEKSDTEIALEERLAQLEAREAEIAAREKTQQISKKLKDAGLPAELSQYLNLGDNIDEGITQISTALGGFFLANGNKPGNHQTNAGITKADFAKMGYTERARLYQENPQLYKALSR